MSGAKRIAVGALVLGMAACAPTTPKSKAPVRVPVYDFKPPETAAPGSANVTIAVINGRFAQSVPWATVYPFPQIATNLGSDFNEVLAARGINTRGPYRSYEEMTFPDKSGSDLILQPSLDFLVSIQAQPEEIFMLIGDNQWKLKGSGTISGRLDLALSESLSNERMWYKSIDVSSTSFTWKGEKRYKMAPGTADWTDPGLANAVAAAMEPVYQQLMNSAWGYIVPEELAIVKKQAEVIKAKKVY